MKVLDPKKAAAVFPLGADDYNPPAYVKPGTRVSVPIESRQQELAILAAHDYGLGALSEEGVREIERLIADLKTEITGR